MKSNYRQQKAELADLIKTAKTKGSDVQRHRAEINKLKVSILVKFDYSLTNWFYLSEFYIHIPWLKFHKYE